MREKLAVLVDGGFVKSKLGSRLGRYTEADDIEKLCYALLGHGKLEPYQLYRIFYYDAPPFEETRLHPISGTQRNFKNSDIATVNRRLLQQVELKENFALRQGDVLFQGWQLADKATEKLSARDPLEYDDIIPNIQQKGVDIRIGLDIAWIATKQLVDAMLLVTGDSDFIPAMKFARREGLRVLLFSFEQHIKPGLIAHADVYIPESDVELPF